MCRGGVAVRIMCWSSSWLEQVEDTILDVEDGPGEGAQRSFPRVSSRAAGSGGRQHCWPPQ